MYSDYSVNYRALKTPSEKYMTSGTETHQLVSLESYLSFEGIKYSVRTRYDLYFLKMIFLCQVLTCSLSRHEASENLSIRDSVMVLHEMYEDRLVFAVSDVDPGPE